MKLLSELMTRIWPVSSIIHTPPFARIAPLATLLYGIVTLTVGLYSSGMDISSIVNVSPTVSAAVHSIEQDTMFPHLYRCTTR